MTSPSRRSTRQMHAALIAAMAAITVVLVLAAQAIEATTP